GGLTTRLRTIAAGVARGRPLRAEPAREARTSTDAALAQIERALGSRARPDGAPPRRRRGAGLTDRLLGRSTAVFAVRLALCLGIAEALRSVLPLPHPYWLLLTVAVVLKPDLGSVFARGLQRTVGTLVGVLLGTAVLAVVPPGPLLLVPITALAFAFPYAAARNYGMLATFITPLVLILVELAGGPVRGLAAGRLLDTLLGAAIVLLVGYLPWPSTWRPRLGLAFTRTVEVLTGYAAVAVVHEDGPAGPARRRAFAALQNLRGDLQSALAEPPPASRAAAAWWPVLGALEQVADDLRGADLVGADLERRREDTRQVVEALRAIGVAMQAGRPARALPVPADGPLAAVGQDLRELRALLAGPLDVPRRATRRRSRPATG
ncbi:FUSC family protein, partial [Amnibacterium endophyticum]